VRRTLKLNRETLRLLTDEESRQAAGGVETTQCQITLLQTTIGNTCNGASYFPTCAPQ
jgi:hypothetical protein